jgi:hypothetical protein
MEELDTMSPDVLMRMVLEFELPDILPLCKVSKRFNKLICNNEIFWMNKTIKDYPKQYQIIKDRNIKVNWKNLYYKIRAVQSGKAKFIRLRTSKSLSNEIMKSNDPKWANSSGLLPNGLQGWSLRLDKNTNSITYFYPSMYYSISPPQVPKQGENHPQIMLKISFPDIIIEEIPWDDSLLGEVLSYHRGDGRVSWVDETYSFKMEYDGGRKMAFAIYSIEL